MGVPGKNGGRWWVSKGDVFQQKNDFRCFGATGRSVVAEGPTQWGLRGGQLSPPFSPGGALRSARNRGRAFCWSWQ